MHNCSDPGRRRAPPRPGRKSLGRSKHLSRCPRMSRCLYFLVFLVLFVEAGSSAVHDITTHKQSSLKSMNDVRPAMLPRQQITVLDQTFDDIPIQSRFQSSSERRQNQRNIDPERQTNGNLKYDHVRDQSTFDSWVDSGKQSSDARPSDMQQQHGQFDQRDPNADRRQYVAEDNYDRDPVVQKKIELGKTLEEADSTMVEKFASSEQVSSRFAEFHCLDVQRSRASQTHG